MESRLSPLQVRILTVLVGLPWTLTGGGALAGYHLGHRTTRDLDLFFHGSRHLAFYPAEIESRLQTAGLDTRRIQTAQTFCRIEVDDQRERIPIDLVADPSPCMEAPIEMHDGVFVDTRHEILVNKLTALLSRWAVRDLVDVRELVRCGTDLDRALEDAPRKDSGFSPETLAWVLDTTPASEIEPDLIEFREVLIQKLLG